MSDSGDPGISDAERNALTDLELAIEHVERAHGHLVEFHHELGHAFDQFADAERELWEVGHDDLAEELREEILPSGVIGEKWTFELLEDFEDGFLSKSRAFEGEVRKSLAEGLRHLKERDLQRKYREEE